ncbi:hypothetical protein IRJ41_006777 [Triplophysa rosa]|uniref:Uncharacterized protein n=1 Tax=Triplophysa rosa TaxID=992332 RepID=A0A9W7WQH9_TRIRA|nr:hypothetical protein IRJ41_006777 [Triplophysa rosa]
MEKTVKKDSRLLESRQLCVQRSKSADCLHCCFVHQPDGNKLRNQEERLLELSDPTRVSVSSYSQKDSSYMGKRLEQQPMYPQYTYYYPHYLQTKIIEVDGGVFWHRLRVSDFRSAWAVKNEDLVQARMNAAESSKHFQYLSMTIADVHVSQAIMRRSDLAGHWRKCLTKPVFWDKWLRRNEPKSRRLRQHGDSLTFYCRCLSCSSVKLSLSGFPFSSESLR